MFNLELYNDRNVDTKTLLMYKDHMYIEHEYVSDVGVKSDLISLTPEQAFEMAQAIIENYVPPSKATFDV